LKSLFILRFSISWGFIPKLSIFFNIFLKGLTYHRGVCYITYRDKMNDKRMNTGNRIFMNKEDIK